MTKLPPNAVRFEVDVRGERDALRLRRVAGVGGGLAGLWLALVAPSWTLRVLGLAASALGLGWGLSARAHPDANARSGAANAGDYLEVGPDGIALCEAGRLRQVHWSELSRAVLDEDRLAVRLECRVGAPVWLESRYAGAGVYEVFEAICAHGAAAGLPGCTRGADG